MYFSRSFSFPWLLDAFIRNAYDKKRSRLIDTKWQSMGPGEALSVFAGTFDHAVTLEARKGTTDGTGTLLLYNTGEGVAMHSFSWNKKYYPLVWTNIPRSHINGDFFQQVLSAKDDPFKALPMPAMDMKYVVNRISSLLGKTPDQWADSCERPYREQGKLGSCTTKSRSVWLHTAMDTIDPSGKLYHQFKYETTDTLIKQFDEVFPEVIGGSPDDDPNRKPDGSELSLGQLREIRKRAGEALERRRTRIVK